MLSVRLLSVGPRLDGRDYGILSRFNDHGLDRDSVALIEDFSRALLDWGLQESGQGFSICLPLPRQSLFLLARIAYRGRQALGPDVLANGILLGPDELALADGYCHRWLREVRDPAKGAWPVTRLRAEGHLSAQQVKGWPELTEIGTALHFYQLPLRIGIEGDAPELALAEILEVESAPLGRRSGWCTTAALSRKEGFDPDSFALQIFAVDSHAEPGVEYPVLGHDGWKGKQPPRSPMAAIRMALFAPADRKARDKDTRAINQAALTARLDADQVDLMVRNAILDALDGQVLPVKTLRALYIDWADRLTALDSHARRGAGIGIASAFMIGIVREPNDDAKAESLHWFMGELGDRIEGVGGLASAVAHREGLLKLLNGSDLSRAIGAGLNDAGTETVTGLAEEGSFEPDQIIGITEGLKEIVRDDPSPPAIVRGLRIMKALISVQADAPPAERNARSFGAVLQLGELLLTKADDDCWSTASGLLARALFLSTDRLSDGRARVVASLRDQGLRRTAFRPGTHEYRCLSTLARQCLIARTEQSEIVS